MEILWLPTLCYIIPMLIMFYIAYYIFKQDWNQYIAGGNTECIIILLVGFIPILNIVFSFIIGGSYLITKLKNKTK